MRLCARRRACRCSPGAARDRLFVAAARRRCRRDQASLQGHANHRQKIQYHLRLKQELEELRHECMVLLRDKFHLEQCLR